MPRQLPYIKYILTNIPYTVLSKKPKIIFYEPKITNIYENCHYSDFCKF